jgi:hypothetical protein
MSIMAVKKLADREVFQDIGIVESIEDSGACTIKTPDGVYRATPAVSCLVEPERGDEVLFAGRQDGDLHVLAIIERTVEGPTRIGARGDIDFTAKEGRLSFVAKEGIDLVTSATLAMASSAFKLNTRTGDIFVEKLTVLAQKALAEVEAVKLFAGLFDSVVERVSQKVNRSFRFVELIDQVRSKQIDYRAEENMSLRGHNTLINADLLTKIDADQVQIG